MSSIAPTDSRQSTQSTSPGVSSNGPKAEGLSDMFMQLLVAQVSHQNPLNPMDGTQYVSQLAEFANVESLQSIRQSSEQSLSLQSAQQMLQATQLIGQQVDVPTNKILLEQESPIQGSVNLASPADELKISLYNSSGDLVSEQTLKKKGPGTLNFSLEKQQPGLYTLQAKAVSNDSSTDLVPWLTGTVERVSVGNSEQDIELQVNGLGNFNLLQTNQIHQQEKS